MIIGTELEYFILGAVVGAALSALCTFYLMLCILPDLYVRR